MSAEVFEKRLRTLTAISLGLEFDKRVPSILTHLRREKEVELTDLLGEETIRLITIILSEALKWLSDAGLLLEEPNSFNN